MGGRRAGEVVSHDPDVDPIGACVGMRGARVQNVVSELRGEKIDIISWTPDVARFACAALAPADVTRVYVDNEDQTMEIIVPDDQLSLAIGKKGQNVRLAAKLTGWRIDIMSETRAAEAELEELTGTLKNESEGQGETEGVAEETSVTGLFKDIPAKEAIEQIKRASSAEELESRIAGETRVTVQRACEDQLAVLGAAADQDAE